MNIKKRPTLYLLIFLAAAFTSQAQAKANWRLVKAKKASKKVYLKVKTGKRTYYHLDLQHPVVIEVQGPARLRIITRLDFAKEDGKDAKYKVLLYRGKKVIKTLSKKTQPTKKAYLGSKTIPGASRSLYLDVPPGKHTYTVKLPKGAHYSVKVRPLVRAKYKFVAIHPDAYAAVVPLVYKERELTYFRLTSAKPVEKTLVGPTVLLIVTSLEFTKSMKGKQRYRIQLLLDGKPQKTYTFAVKKADTVSYKSEAYLVPSQKKEIYYKIPKGRHKVSLKVIDTNAQGVLCNLLIPEKHITNGG